MAKNYKRLIKKLKSAELDIKAMEDKELDCHGCEALFMVRSTINSAAYMLEKFDEMSQEGGEGA